MLSSNQADNSRRDPLVIVSVEGGVLHSRNGQYNIPFIYALSGNVTEVYLLTPRTFSQRSSQTLRKTVGEAPLRDIVLFLKQCRITVKAIVTRYDLATKMPGSYYAAVIEPQEKRVSENPAIDLSKDEVYQTLLKAQETMQPQTLLKAQETMQPVVTGDVDLYSQMMNSLFVSLKNQGILSTEKNPRTVLFFDEQPKYLAAFKTCAENHGIIHHACFQVRENLPGPNYRDFLLSVNQQVEDFHERIKLLAQTARAVAREIHCLPADEDLRTSYDGITKAFALASERRNSKPLENLLQNLKSELIKYKIADKKNLASKFIDDLARMTKDETEKDNIRKCHEKKLTDLPQENTVETLKKLDDVLVSLAEEQMRMKIKIVEAEEKNLPTPEAETIRRVTFLPSPIVSLINDYLPEKPTQEEIDEVNRDINNLRSRNLKKEWAGVRVVLSAENRILDEVRSSLWIDLHALQLEGLVFGETKKGSSSEMKAMSSEEASSELARWKDSKKPVIAFLGASLQGAKFEDILCVDLGFDDAILTGASFKLSRLSDVSFRRTKLDKADFSFCFSDHTRPDIYDGLEYTFDGADLRGATFEGSHFKCHSFKKAEMDGANLCESVFEFGDFSEASMEEANLAMADFSNAGFFKTKLSAAFAAKADFTGANFLGADLKNVDFTGATLTDAVFGCADLTGAHVGYGYADLTGAHLTGATYDLFRQFSKSQVLSFYYMDENATRYIEAIYKEKEKFYGENFLPDEQECARKLIQSFIDGPYEEGQNVLLNRFLRTGKLSGNGIEENALRTVLLAVQREIENERRAERGDNAESKTMPVDERYKNNLAKVNLHSRSYKRARFTRVLLDGANLGEIHCDDATFTGCSMVRANLCGGHFERASFSGLENGEHRVSVLLGADARGANFTKANFEGVNLQNVIFIGAILTGANFAGADMSGAHLADAQFDLGKFSRQQVLSFYYGDKTAKSYIEAIYDYMETHTGWNHKTGLERAEKLIRSFINGHPYGANGNKLLAAFLATGKLPGENDGVMSSMFSSASSDSDPNSLLSKLKAVQKKIAEQEQAIVVVHTANLGNTAQN